MLLPDELLHEMPPLTTSQLKRLRAALYYVDGTADLYQWVQRVAVRDGVEPMPPISISARRIERELAK
jgi:hypothetical protein